MNDKINHYQEIKRANSLLCAVGNLSTYTTKIWYLAISDMKKRCPKYTVLNKDNLYTTIFSKHDLKPLFPKVFRNYNEKEIEKIFDEISLELSNKSIGIVQKTDHRKVRLGSYATLSGYDLETQELRINHNPDTIKYVDGKHCQSGYTIIDYAEIQDLNGYQLKIYDLCSQYKATKNKSRQDSIEWLRIVLNVGNSHKKISDFIKYVIEEPIKKINNSKHTIFNIDFEKIKTGRRITHIKFTIAYKFKNSILNLDDKKQEIKDLHGLLTAIGIQQSRFKYIATFPMEHVINAARSTLKFIDSGKKFKQGKGPTEYLIGTLRNTEEKQSKSTIGQIAHTYFSLLSTTDQNALNQAFVNQLSKEDIYTYNQRFRLTESAKNLLERDFLNKKLEWIYKHRIAGNLT